MRPPVKPTCRLLCLLAFLLTAGLAQANVPADWPDPFEMRFEAVEITAPEPRREVLENGMVVYLLEDRSLPLVDGVAYLRAPSLFDPEDKVGLANLTAGVMRSGGAGELSPDELDEALEFLAASIEASASTLFASVSFSALSDNVDEVLALFAEMLMRPNFDEGRLEIARGQALEAIRRENDQPVQIAGREFLRRLAEGHPAGYFPTVDTVNAIAREDLIDFHARFFKPNATVLALSGDFDSEELLAELEATFAGWEPAEIVYPSVPEFNPRPEPKVYLAPREVGQSIIYLGHPSVLAYSPAYNDLDVANHILGAGGFTSRIFTEIRTRRGLAYATGSALTQGFDYPGYFYAVALSRTDRTAEVIELLFAEIERLQHEPVSPEELELHKNAILNSAVFRFTTPGAIVQRTARALELLGLEPGYYERYLERVQEITPEDVQSVMQQEVRPEEMVIMVVGDPAQFDRPLDEFGEVVTIELE